MSYAVVVEGLSALEDFRGLQKRIELAALRSINRAARDGRSDSAKMIYSQVAFPAGFLGPKAGRLFVAKQAQRGSLKAIIRARGRPTSLARFVTASSRARGVTLQVSPGKATFMRRAFLIKLRRGTAGIETKFNQGLAIRLRPGERLDKKIKQVQLSKGLTLLYGPSVQQVFLDNQGRGVAKDISPDILDTMEGEFLRLLKL